MSRELTQVRVILNSQFSILNLLDGEVEGLEVLVK